MESAAPISLNNLPAEMLTECLHCISTKELLSLRSVNSTWNEAIKSISRNRCVSINLSRFYDQPSLFHRIFPNILNLPWSGIKIEVSDQSKIKIADTLTKYIRSITIFMENSNYSNILDLFQHLPYLQHIHIGPKDQNNLDSIFLLYEALAHARRETGPGNSNSNLPEFSAQEINIRKLTQLTSVLTCSESVQFLKFILLQTGAPVKKLDINIIGLVDDLQLQEVFEIISRSSVRNICLHAYYSNLNVPHWKILAAQNLNLIQRIVIFYSHEYAQSFKFLKKFLLACCQLQELELHGFWGHKRRSCFQIPALPCLQSILINYDYNYHPTASENNPGQYSYIHPISPQEFPELRQVILQSKNPNIQCGFRQLFECSAMTFDSVRSLRVDDYSRTYRWATIFPNLRQLEATVCKKSQCENRISDSFVHLQQFKLT